MTAHISPQSLKVVSEEPRIYDLDLAAELEFAQPRDIRKLISRNLDELRRYGEVCATVAQTSELGGRPGTEYWLNEAQAVLVTMFSRTDRAAEAREAIIAVFLAWRKAHPPAVEILEPLPAPGADSAQSLNKWRLDAVKEARLLFGPARAARLWEDLGLPRVPAPPSAEAISRECLDVLMESTIFDEECGQTLREHLRLIFALDDEEAAAKLNRKGVRVVFEGEQGLLIANCGRTLEDAYRGTRFALARWIDALRRIPGVRAHSVATRFGSDTHRCTFVPWSVIARP